MSYLLYLILLALGCAAVGYAIRAGKDSDEVLDAREEMVICRAQVANAKSGERVAVLRMKEAHQHASRLATRIHNQRRIISWLRNRLNNPSQEMSKEKVIRKANSMAKEVLSEVGH